MGSIHAAFGLTAELDAVVRLLLGAEASARPDVPPSFPPRRLIASTSTDRIVRSAGLSLILFLESSRLELKCFIFAYFSYQV